MKRLASPILGVLLAMALATSACDKTAPSEPNEVIAFGDSLVYGSGSTSGNDFVSLLSQRLGINIRNAGFPGDTTLSAKLRLNGAVLARNPRLVIVLLGANDLFIGAPVADSVSNITTIVQQIRAKGAKVVLVGMTVDATLDPFKGALPGIASQTSSSFVPGVLDGWYGDPAYLAADGTHPNNAGHKILADRVEPVLRTALMASQAAAQFVTAR